MDELASRLSALSPAQRALLELRLKKQQATAAPAAETIPRRQQEDYRPLSLDQERIWFIQQLDLDSPAYNIYTANRFVGALDVDVLTRSLNEIVRRHEIMRTSFDAVDGTPAQIVAPSLMVDIPLLDLRALSHEERGREAELVASDLVRRPFCLTRLPLFRSVLLRVDEEAYISATVFHHIITDWVSFHVFERELAILYEAFMRGRPSPLPELSIQYADFAVWQRQWLKDKAITAHLDYWRSQMADAPLVLDLPRDRPRPVAQTPWGHRQPVILSKAHSDAIRRIAQQEEVTLFMALLAVFKVLLFRISGQEKLIVGSPIANRNRIETEGLIGFFINQLALCTDLSGNPTFRDLLHRVRETALGAYAHQEMPFGKLVEELRPERALSHTPLTQVVFLFLNPQQQGTVKLGDLTVLPYTVDGESSKFDITFSLWDSETGFEGFIEYNTDLFDGSTIIRMAEQFRTLLAGIIADPDQRISELPILTAGPRHQLLVEWNSLDAEQATAEGCVHQLFETQVELTPDAVAVVGEDEQLSYRELNYRANSLACRLRVWNVGPDTPVGILMKRSPKMIVAILAVLKAGAAYLPLDPNEPVSRVAWMLEDARVSVLLSQTGVADRLPASNVRVIDLDYAWEQLTGDLKENQVSHVSNRNLAYVIYTSGSTGQPKGVAIEHRSLVNLVTWHQSTYQVKPSDRASLFAGPAFDASVWELWPYLTAGASIHLPDEETHASMILLIEWLETQAITICFLPTPLAQAALEEIWPENLPLRCLLTGGDSLHRIPKLNTPFSVFNHYGPTENTVVSTAGRVNANIDGGLMPSIGRPIAKTQVYLLDRYLQPVPSGVRGEICVAGIGLARGYLNRPDLTAERFVAHPFSSEPGARLYRTGDLARYRSDGQLEFLGRVDHQVKVRGFRIELGEIEATLNGHCDVRESLVMTREDVPGQKRLVAYVVPEREGLDTAVLRDYLKEKLPDYMIPAAFVFLPIFPLMRNGKIDRGALRPPGAFSQGKPKTFTAPSTAIERQLAKLWSQVLGLDRVGTGDNFFELGGDSILSIQIIAKANRMGVRLTPKQIFLHQTIAELAVVAGAGESVFADQGVVTGEIPLTPIQHWLFEQNLPEVHHFNQSLLLEVHERIEPQILEQAIERVFAHHDALHLRFTSEMGTWRQINAAPDEPTPFTCIDYSELKEDGRENVTAEVSSVLQESLNLSAGPLVRAVLIQEGAGRSNWLLLIIHHLAVDAVSWRILLEDLQEAYEQAKSGNRVELPAKTTSLKRWAERLVQHARTTVLEEEAAPWTTGGWTTVGTLPVDHPGESNTVGAARSIEISLNGDETRTLLQEVPGAYRARIDEVLLTALALAFEKFTGKRKLVVDLEGHGREDIFNDVDLSRTVGWFTSIYPVLLDLDEAETINDAVKVTKEKLRRIPNRGLDYGLLRYLRADDAVRERLGKLPQADVSFNYLGQFDQSLRENSFLISAREAPGLARSPRGIRRHLLEINGSVAGGCLSLMWTFGGNLYEPATVERLAGNYLKVLKAIIADCAPGKPRGFTPSDFPLARLDQNEIDWLVINYPQVEDIYPLSPIQQGFLFHTLSAPDSGMYIEQLSSELIGDLDLHAFEEAWQRVVDRHSILRTAFLWREFDAPLQIVHRRVVLKPDLRDLRELPPAEQQAHLQAFMITDRERGFDVSSAPLMRLSIFRTAAQAYQFVWSHHHLLLDGWSMPLVLKEVMAHYNAACIGGESRSEAVRPFRDYIQWLQRQDQSKAELFWRRLLKGFKEVTPLGADQVRAGGSNEKEYGDETIQISEADTEGLQALARQHHLTLNTLIRGAWALLLSQYSGREDVLFGVTVSGRPPEVKGIETMVGLFINTLPLRLHVSREAKILSWLQRLQAEQVEMNQYEYCALAQEWHDMPRGRPLFESLLVFENYPGGEFTQDQNAAVGVRHLRVSVRTKYPLTLVVAPGEKLVFNIAYDRNRFAPQTVAGMLTHMAKLLISIAANPKQKILSLPIPPDPAERELPTAAPAALWSTAQVAPRTPVEEMLAGIWADLLGLERVGIYTNFFELGGHSLIATQVISRVRDAFSIELPLRHLFEAMTVAGLAERIELTTQAGQSAREVSSIAPARHNGYAPLSLAQEPLWLLDQALPGNSFFNVTTAIRLVGSLNISPLKRAFAEIVDRHEALRTTFAEVDGEPMQVIAAVSTFKLRVVDLRDLAIGERECEASRLAANDAKRAFDLATGPLLRISLLQLGNEEYTALVTMHHIIADAWAVGVLVRELATLYEAFSNGDPSPLPSLPIQYADYSIWQRQWLQGQNLQNQVTFWKKQLDGALEPLNLPTDFPRLEQFTFGTRLQTLRLPEALSAAVRDASRTENVTLFMMLMTAFQVLLHCYTGQQDIRVGTLVANRNHAETEGLIALFVNTLVIRTSFSGDLTYRQVLQQMRETVLQAFNHQDLPFESLMEALESECEINRTSLIEVLFIFQNAPLQPLKLRNLQVLPIEDASKSGGAEVTLTTFDLVVMIWEGPDGLEGSIRYKTSLFNEATISEMQNNFQDILAAIASDSSQPIPAPPYEKQREVGRSTGD